VKDLAHASFAEMAERIGALYNEEQDTLLLPMLGQEYVIRHDGILLRGQKAPEAHASVLLEYLFSRGTTFTVSPWRAIGELTGTGFPDFRKKTELPITQYVAEIIARAKTLLPLFDARMSPSLTGSDMAIIVHALPKVYLHVEMAQENQDFPAEVWILFSNNARDFLNAVALQGLAEVFKDRLLSLLRIY
jgi:hypothetical protein